MSPFGLLVAIGIVVGVWYAFRLAKKTDVDQKELDIALFIGAISGFTMAHWFAVVLYHPNALREQGPILLLKITNGLSSYGGFVGAVGGVAFFYMVIKKKPWTVQIELLTQGVVLSWVFGRLACALAYDHPGIPTEFFLGQEYSDGTVRHNLGLYECLYTALVMVPAMVLAGSRKPPPGFVLGIICVVYAPVRFALDMLRATDLAGSDARR